MDALGEDRFSHGSETVMRELIQNANLKED